jgi:mRNA-degrading endonuclease RelE of RelBE toxin-antitoxin system
MNLEIKPTSIFNKQLKKLIKKYPSIIDDVAQLEEDLQENPFLGEALGKKCYKIRVAISSKNRGKSGGGRVITQVLIEDETVYLLSIYDKSEQDSIAEQEIEQLLKYIDLKE